MHNRVSVSSPRNRVTRSAGQVLEGLESRQLLSAVYPTANEQLMLEMVNLARANPVAQAARYGIDLNEGLAAGTVSTAPKQPLAFNPFLIDSARGHSQDMIDNDYFAHNSPTGSTPGTRMTASGYTAYRGWGENIAWSGSTGAVDQTALTGKLEDNLFVDSGISGRGHRLNLLNDSYKEAGMGIVSGVYTTGGRNYNAVMATQDFAIPSSGTFLTGVAYTDAIARDSFYTPGEGMSGVKVTATRITDNAQFSTATWSSGGYSLKLDPGTYTVTASGGGLTSPIVFSNVAISTRNVKEDFVPSAVVAPPPAANTPPGRRMTSTPTVSVAGGTAYQFQITYYDPDGVNASTLGNGDVRILGPNGFSQLATFVSATPSGDATSVLVTYRITPPGGSWDASDNSAYSIYQMGNEVADTKGLFAPYGKIGQFTVAI